MHKSYLFGIQKGSLFQQFRLFPINKKVRFRTYYQPLLAAFTATFTRFSYIISTQDKEEKRPF